MTEEVTLAQCPIGLFWAGDELCLKTEYGNNEGRIDAYIVSTGEFFWGSHPQTIPNQRMQMVRPVPEEALTRLTAQSGEGRSGAGEDALGAHLRTLWEAVTAGDLSTAERHNDCELVECPMCHEGSIEAADYCNIDGKALGVQFYGIGPEHGAHERLWTAVIANFPKILAALNARQSGEGEREALPRDVRRLVIAARLALESQDDEALGELDRASEAFASLVPWNDEPEDVTYNRNANGEI